MNSRTVCLIANFSLTVILWLALSVSVFMFLPVHWGVSLLISIVSFLPLAFIEQHLLSGFVNSIFYREGD